MLQQVPRQEGSFVDKPPQPQVANNSSENQCMLILKDSRYTLLIKCLRYQYFLTPFRR